MAPDWCAAMLPSELSSRVYCIWGSSRRYPQVVPKVNAWDTKWGTCRALWWTPKLLFLRKVHYSFNEHWGGRWAAKPLACNGWASAPHKELTQAHTNSDEFVVGKWLAPRNVGKTVERGQHLAGASGTQGDQTRDETWVGAWNGEPRPRRNSKDWKTHLFGCLVPSHSVLHPPSMDGQTMSPTTKGWHY